MVGCYCRLAANGMDTGVRERYTVTVFTVYRGGHHIRTVEGFFVYINSDEKL